MNQSDSSTIGPSRRKLTEKEIRDHAYHEAGHAVAAVRLALGLKGNVRVFPSGDVWTESAYQETYFGKTDTSQRGTLDQNAAFYLAGPAAERRYNPNITNTDHWEGDRRSFFDLFSEDPKAIDHWDTHWARTEALLNRNWAAVEAVADAILSAEEYSISAQQVEDIVREISNQLNFAAPPEIL
jgi:ATP-dependent Zn protease